MTGVVTQVKMLKVISTMVLMMSLVKDFGKYVMPHSQYINVPQTPLTTRLKLTEIKIWSISQHVYISRDLSQNSDIVVTRVLPRFCIRAPSIPHIHQ